MCIYLLFFNTQRIAYVESAQIFQEYKGARAEHEKLERHSRKFKLKLDTLSREIDEMIIRQDGRSEASAKQLIQLKQKQLEDYRRSAQQTLQTEETAATEKIAEQLNVFLKEYGKRKGYKFILIASPSGTIAYAAEGTNLTDDVLKEINAK
ncbi:OmpH family outer membrane protein [Sphingobacterium sp.]|uniref:OmpH family outer membrane protein n=1 Tax=Sphingobacterium sp. TaxID=341027 RepID=UPI002FDC8E70